MFYLDGLFIGNDAFYWVESASFIDGFSGYYEAELTTDPFNAELIATMSVNIGF